MCDGRRREGGTETDFLGEGPSGGHAEKERIGGFVDRRVSGEGGRSDESTDTVLGFDNRDLQTRVECQKTMCAGETGDSAADDDDPTGRGPVVQPAASMTRRASAAITRASSLTHAMRSNSRPRDSACFFASMSRS